MIIPDLTTVAGVEAELVRQEASHEAIRKAGLTVWQTKRKHLRALLDVLRDNEGYPDAPSDKDRDKEKK